MPSYEELMVDTVSKTKITDRFILSSPSKVSCKSHCAFSLPAGPKFSCPDATEACTKCYATRYRHLFPSVQNAFAKNWKLIRGFEKKNDVYSAATMISGSIPNIGLFRIHESGDFYSQWYINTWNNIIKSRKDINFWTYTRSFDFDYSRILRNKNFVLWASTDDFNFNKATKMVRKYKSVKHAFGPFEKNKDIPQNSFICPVTNKKSAIEGACEKCGFCTTKDRAKKNIIFLRH